MLNPLSFPIGKFDLTAPFSVEERRQAVESIASLPARLRAAVSDLSEARLDTPYRPGGWSVRQVVHHLADSHLNAYTRYKLALTEAEPVIKAYDQDRWAELPDSRLPVGLSLTLLDSVHQRWVAVMRAMSEEQWQRRLQHPELGIVVLQPYAGAYAWHGNHHLAHITGLREREGWPLPSEINTRQEELRGK